MRAFLHFFWLCCTLLLVACNKTPSQSNVLKIGTIAGPETILMEVAADIVQRSHDIKITVVPFDDYIMPNLALHEKSIDANMYQHAPYLHAAMQQRGYRFHSLGPVFLYPMGLYSKKHPDLASIPNGARFGLPNDPSNFKRSLLLAEAAGLLTVDPGKNEWDAPTIVRNPKNLSFVQMDAAQAPTALRDLDLIAINTNYAVPAGLFPERDALFVEDAHSPYANLFVCREDNAADPRLRWVLDALRSDEVLERAQFIFQNQVLPAWKKKGQ